MTEFVHPFRGPIEHALKTRDVIRSKRFPDGEHGRVTGVSLKEIRVRWPRYTSLLGDPSEWELVPEGRLFDLEAAR